MQLQIVQPNKPKVRLALQGPSGCGKTYNALLLAYGLTGAYEKIAIIDTDGAASLYSYFGPFSTIQISAPFSSQKFQDAIELCERSGIEAIIIDSISAEWADEGGVLNCYREGLHDDSGFRDDVIESHAAFMQTLRNCSIHLIGTIRTKEGYHLSLAGGKKEVQKIGLDPIQQEGIHYHFHTVLALDSRHRARPLKDRTSFFEDTGTVVITEETAALHAKWCGEAIHSPVPDSISAHIRNCNSLKALLALMQETETEGASIIQAFQKRKLELQQIELNPILSRQNPEMNGTDIYRATA